MCQRRNLHLARTADNPPALGSSRIFAGGSGFRPHRKVRPKSVPSSDRCPLSSLTCQTSHTKQRLSWLGVRAWKRQVSRVISPSRLVFPRPEGREVWQNSHQFAQSVPLPLSCRRVFLAFFGRAPPLQHRKIRAFRTLILVRPIGFWPGQKYADFIDCGVSLAKGLTSSASPPH